MKFIGKVFYTGIAMLAGAFCYRGCNPQSNYRDMSLEQVFHVEQDALDKIVSENPNRTLQSSIQYINNNNLDYTPESRLALFKEASEVMEDNPEISDFLGSKTRKRVVSTEVKNGLQEFGRKTRNAIDNIVGGKK